ncbi:DNA topoisomerase 2 [Linum perenne]
MVASKKAPLMTSSSDNVGADPSSNNNGPQKTIEEMYQKKTQLEHILLRPDTYIGSIEKHTQMLWVYEEGKMVNRSVTYVPGLYKIFDEILVNAADNKQRDPRMNSLKVTIDVENNLVSVYNNGDGVPVEVHKEEGVYVPELIFGHLLTSSNYDDNEKKTTGGRNGYGAKLTNIFSTEFVIETADGKRLKKYKQVFNNNMGTKSEPAIIKCKASENWTKVSFKPDLEKFNMSHLEEDVVALMRKRVVDMAGCLGKGGVKVELDGNHIPLKSFQDYVNLYLDSTSEPGARRTSSFYEKCGDRWEICVGITEGQFQQVSFVNSIATIKGGTHVDYVTNQITSHVTEVVNKKHRNAHLKAHNVKNYLWVFVNALIDNPAFDSQTKETLTLRQSSFGSTCQVSDDLLKKVVKSEIVDNLLNWAQFKQQKELKKTDGSKTSRINVPKLEDANEAGGKNSDKCTLILTEGDSAKGLAVSIVSGLSVVGRDYYGVFPLRGKLLNVREATVKQLNENKEIQHLKKILGLRQDKQYEDVKSLRYGHMMIMTDQDHDGSHIKGLLINFIHSFWPSLLRVPSFVVEFITPIVKATSKRGQVLSFYTMPEYKTWSDNLGAAKSNWSIKYYKGLGTSTDKEGKEYFSDLDKHKKDFMWLDDNDGNAIELAFSKKKIEARKDWIRQHEPGTHLDQTAKLIKYSDFINKELILFSVADLQRSIPSMVDGLKPGQRKILFAAFKKNLVKELKLSQFIGYVSEQSAYHHGEASLYSTIVGMAQNFVGSNNINLFVPAGNFGTRASGGKNAASARYIHTCLSLITRFLFPKDDDCILDYLEDDGQSIEPTWYMPILPMALVNGSEGIGTGWSTFVPNYNPRDIVANLRRLLNDEMMEPMEPWYKGFRGTIVRGTGFSYTSSGVIDEVDETTIKVTELPIRTWTENFREFLKSVTEGLKDENGNVPKDPLIKGFHEQGDDYAFEFTITLSEEKVLQARSEGLLKKFKLTSSINTSNMHLFDPSGRIKKYDNPEQVIEEFFHLRLEYYDKRKKTKLAALELELLRLSNKVRFILAVVNGEIIVNNRKRAELIQELHQKGFTPMPIKSKSAAASETTEESEEGDDDQANASGIRASDYDYLLSMAISTLTFEKVQKLLEDRDKLNGEVDALRMMTPKDLWLHDLDAFEKQLDLWDVQELEAQEELDRKLRPKCKQTRVVNAPKPRNKAKAVPKPKTVEEDMEAMKLSTSSAMETTKPKPKAAAAKKAPAKKGKKPADDSDDDEVKSLKDRLKAYKLDDSSPENSAEAKKASVVDLDGDEEPEVVAVAAAPAKKGGRKPAAPKPAAAKAPAKKRGAAAAKQKLLPEMFKPAESEGISPEKKVRKMRESPFNKKSGSVLGKAGNEVPSSLSGIDEISPASETTEETIAPPPRARPVRANRRPTKTYVLSDSDDTEEDDPATEVSESESDSDGSV